jgi:MoaA/NifB/PqqE/SkfB family radical SAM enzyme
MLPALSKKSLAKAALFQNTPIYVQFYITARCNLTCQQCNVIYANSDARECTLDEIKSIADNLAKLGVAIVLLTGGEPFTRKDLPEIIKAFSSRGIHVRMQTNGLAHREMIHDCIESGGRDISISLDSLTQTTQDKINGGFEKSWNKALEAMANFTQLLPTENSFAALGCVMQRDNLHEIEDVIKLGTEASWFTSLVPVHTTTHSKPRSFRSFDQTLNFRPDEFAAVDSVIERVRGMRNEGYLLYDSDQYLDDMKKFIRGEPTSWRSKNDGVCDSPNLYFAILPNGQFAPCCDLRLPETTYTYAADFEATFWSSVFRAKTKAVVSACSGCMYGSYPEMTISMRYWAAKWDRFKLFMARPPKKNWPLQDSDLYEAAARIRRG